MNQSMIIQTCLDYFLGYFDANGIDAILKYCEDNEMDMLAKRHRQHMSFELQELKDIMTQHPPDEDVMPFLNAYLWHLTFGGKTVAEPFLFKLENLYNAFDIHRFMFRIGISAVDEFEIDNFGPTTQKTEITRVLSSLEEGRPDGGELEWLLCNLCIYGERLQEMSWGNLAKDFIMSDDEKIAPEVSNLSLKSLTQFSLYMRWPDSWDYFISLSNKAKRPSDFMGYIFSLVLYGQKAVPILEEAQDFPVDFLESLSEHIYL